MVTCVKCHRKPQSHKGIGDGANHSVGNDLEVRILHTAFADEWNGIPRKSHDLEIVGSTPASAISELRGSQINIFSDSPP